jgi:formylglycine-generating enzyme required for sulfatase activity
MRILARLVVYLLFTLHVGTPAYAARLALVIGNDSYSRVEPLRNARADARAMARALEGAGFRVSLVLDQDQSAMKAALRRFKASLAGGDEAVFFYAGHGVELGGVNYLLPTDIRDDSDDQLQDDAIPLQRVLSDLAQQKPKFSLSIIDACRDDPFKGSGRNVGSRGLAPVTAVTGQMVIYSAGAGQKALDRLSDADKSPNGVFTRVFVKAMERDGVPVQELVGTVREEVARLAASVGKEQVPAAYDQVIGKFYFRGSGSAKPTRSVEATPTPGPDGDEQIWQEARRLETVEGYEAYLEAYPKGKYAAMARAAKRKLESATKVEVPPVARGEYPTGKVFRDCGDCPEMVVIPGGSFEMGSPSTEGGSDGDEGPAHTVRVRRFGLGKTEVTRGQFRRFVRATGRSVKGCSYLGGEAWKEDPGRSWESPGYEQTDEHPVVCVSWEDAQAYVSWLSGTSGKDYRLPSESEWEYSARAGTRTVRHWGDGQGEACRYANAADQAGKRKFNWDPPLFACDDGYAETAPAGSFQSNGFGLKDMLGNVNEWTQDCYEASYGGAPTDGSAVTGSGCARRAVRGGSWDGEPAYVRSAFRGMSPPAIRYSAVGFRVARTLP